MFGYFEVEVLTLGHKCMGVAALLGAVFAVLHPITVITTVVVAGANWGITAWMLDISGYLAAVCFALLCRQSSSTRSLDYKKKNSYIFFWAIITFCVRIFDILLLFGIVKFDEIYVTPTGAVLAANIVSEIIVAVPYCLLAAVAGLALFFCPKDADDLAYSKLDG